MAAFVSLIGAGPGDPELITVRGQRALAAADVVIHDDLVDRRLLISCAGRPVYGLGDRRAPAAERQRLLYTVLAEQARAGRRVAHLKGGDPLLYGRGAEEIQFLRAAGIPYEIVPGITAAAAAAAYAELPLTRRRRASSVALCTGHTGQVAVPEADTLVYYMAAGRLAEVAQRVLAHGRSPDTPVALVRNASRPEQSVTTLTLGAAARLPAADPPLVAVIGPGGAPLAGEVDPAAAEVIAAFHLPVLQMGAAPRAVGAAAEGRANASGQGACSADGGVPKGRPGSAGAPGVAATAGSVAADAVAGADAVPESWFATARKVLVTGTTAEPYRHLGELVHTPLIAITDPEDWQPLDAALDRIASYTLVAFTSRYAVAALLERLLARGADARRLAHARLAAIGRSTAAALRVRGLAADIVAREENSGGLLAALRAAGPLAGEQVLLPCSSLADDSLADALRAAGAEVTAVAAYRNVATADPVRVDLASLDAVLFTSPSTVEAFRRLYGTRLPAPLALWCRGPRTRRAAGAAFGPRRPVAAPPVAHQRLPSGD